MLRQLMRDLAQVGGALLRIALVGCADASGSPTLHARRAPPSVGGQSL
jgi:hypothetical protein